MAEPAVAPILTSTSPPKPERSIAAAAGRAALALVVIGAGSMVLALSSRLPAYGRTHRGTVALQLLSRLLLRALGVRVTSCGRPRSGASLVVANQVSWMDVMVLQAAGSMVPVTRSDVLGWPLIGLLSTRAGMLFIDGDCRRQLPRSVDEITGLLRRGHRVQVFPGAAATGSSSAPFHRAAFQAAVDAAVVISPVAITYPSATAPSATARSSLVTGPIGDDDVLRSAWRVLRSGPMTVRTHCLPVIPAVVGAGHPAEHRAAAAHRAERAIGRALGQPVDTRDPTAVTTRERPVLVS